MSFFDLFRSPEKRFENKVKSAFESVIYIACHDAAGNNFTTDARIIHAISVAYDATLKSEKLRNESGMSSDEYEQFVKDIMNQVGRKKLNNWDQIVSSIKPEQ